jgi:hypothetical protein
MTLGLAERQGGLFNVAVQRCEAELPERSIYRLLHRERDRLLLTSCSPTCTCTTPPVCPAVDPGGGDGVAAAGGLLGPGGGRPLRL